MVVVVYAMGFIITAASSTLSAYVVGAVFVNIGSTGLDLLVTSELSLDFFAAAKSCGF